MASYIQNVPAQLPTDPNQIDMGEVLRQRRLAEQLAASSAEVLPAGQMVGNRFVPTAWTQSLAKAVDRGLSGYLSKRADDREKELVTERNAKRLAAFRASAGLPAEESVVEEGGAAQSPYSGAFNGSVKYDASNPADYSDASLNPMRNRSTVGVTGQRAPALTERQMIAKRIAESAAATGQDPYGMLAMDPFAQSDLRIAEAMRTPRELSAGSTFGIPGQAPVMTNQKPTAPRELKTVEVQAVDAQGKPRYDQNNDPVLELRTFDPTTGQLGADALGTKPGNTGTKVTASATATNAATKGVLEGAGDAVKDNIKTVNAAAQGAPKTISTIHGIRKALDSDKVSSGPGTTLGMALKQIAQNAGFGVDQAALNKTREVITGLATLTLESRAELKGSGQITDKETSLLEQARSGNINQLSVGEIRTILDIAERTQRYHLQRNRAIVDNLRKNPAAAETIQFLQVDEPPEYKADEIKVKR